MFWVFFIYNGERIYGWGYFVMVIELEIECEIFIYSYIWDRILLIIVVSMMGYMYFLMLMLVNGEFIEIWFVGGSDEDDDIWIDCGGFVMIDSEERVIEMEEGFVFEILDNVVSWCKGDSYCGGLVIFVMFWGVVIVVGVVFMVLF